MASLIMPKTDGVCILRDSSSCLICNKSKKSGGSDCKDIFTHDALQGRLEPVLQVALTESSCPTRWLCNECEKQLGIIELYYKVLGQFKYNFVKTASLYGLELVPLQTAAPPKSAYDEGQGQPHVDPQGQGHTEGSQGQGESLLGVVQSQEPVSVQIEAGEPLQAQGQVHGHLQQFLQEPERTLVTEGQINSQTLQGQISQPAHFLHQLNPGSQWEEIVFCVESQQGDSVTTVTVPPTIAGTRSNVHIAPAPTPSPDQQNSTGNGGGQAGVSMSIYSGREVAYQLATVAGAGQAGQRALNCSGQHNRTRSKGISRKAILINPQCEEGGPSTEVYQVISIETDGSSHFVTGGSESLLDTVATDNSVSRTRQYVCRVCNGKFKTLAHLKQHMRTHTGERPFPCSNCSATFSNVSNLNRHVMIHRNLRPYSCPVCDATFTQAGHLKRHQGIHAGTNRKGYTCQTCDRKYTTTQALKEHQRAHTGQRPYQCPVCHKRFSRRGICNEHMVIHSSERPYKCSDCSSAFRRKNDLRVHQQTHSVEKPFICVICDAKFTQSGSLAVHKRIHTGEKPFVCELCPERFIRSSNRWKHRKLHYDPNSDVKPYIPAPKRLKEDPANLIKGRKKTQQTKNRETVQNSEDGGNVATPSGGENTPTSPARVGENTPTSPARAGGNTPTSPARVGENTPTSPARAGENTPTSPARAGENTPTSPARAGGNTPTSPARAGENTPTSPARADK